MKKQSLTQWIKENRQELDECIKRACPNCRLDDQERRLWVLNDEGLIIGQSQKGLGCNHERQERYPR